MHGRPRASKQRENPLTAPVVAQAGRAFDSPVVAAAARPELAHSYARVQVPAGFEAPVASPVQAKRASREGENRTDMPDRLKNGLETLSGMDLSGVRVHRNSDKPAKVQALAYTQGRDIHVAPGQERHLPHEGWHAVQQMQGRVKPTMKAHGVAINDNAGLEREADVMGKRALQRRPAPGRPGGSVKVPEEESSARRPAQRQVIQRTRWVWNGEEWEATTTIDTPYPSFDGGAVGAVFIEEPSEVEESVESDEDRAAGITSTDNDRTIGPFNGGRGSRSEVPPSDGAVYYDARRRYCISVDNSGHAGVGCWKLFSYSGRRWQRIDTLWPDGRRMYRG